MLSDPPWARSGFTHHETSNERDPKNKEITNFCLLDELLTIAPLAEGLIQRLKILISEIGNTGKFGNPYFLHPSGTNKASQF